MEVARTINLMDGEGVPSRPPTGIWEGQGIRVLTASSTLANAGGVVGVSKKKPPSSSNADLIRIKTSIFTPPIADNAFFRAVTVASACPAPPLSASGS